MASQKLFLAQKLSAFEFIVLFHPKLSENGGNEEKDSKTELVAGPKLLLASSRETALLKIAKELPDKYMDCLDQVEIIIRPF